jgi:hypothetical protein
METVIRKKSIVRKPVIIAASIATVSVATLLLVNHTNLIVDRRPPQSPPGTTFNTVNSSGAVATPSQPEAPIKPKPPGPTPVQPANPAK